MKGVSITISTLDNFNEGCKHFCLRDIKELLYSNLAEGLPILNDRSRSSRQDKLNLEDLYESIASSIGQLQPRPGVEVTTS